MKENKIVLIGTGRHQEATADSAITPGMLIAHVLGNVERVVPHATEGGHAERFFACEDALQGRTIDDAYAEDDIVTGYLPLPGDEIGAWLKAGENVQAGETLVSNGDGTLVAASSVASPQADANIVAVAREDLDLSASGDEDTRIAVRIV